MKKLLTILVMFIIISLLCLFILLPKEDFSEIENRSLTNLPKFSLSKIVDGSYMEDIEEYINDHFPFRNIFMNIRTISNKYIGKENIGDVYFSDDDYLIEKYDEVRNQDRIISVINDFYDNNIDKNISVMFVPTKIFVYQDKLPKNVDVYNQGDVIKYLYDGLNNDIKKIDIGNKLLEEKDNYQLFYKTDHHWTTYGAYFGYMEYALENKIDYIDISLFNKEVISDSFIGSTYSKVVDPMSMNEEIVLFNYKSYDIDVNYVMSDKNTKTLYNFMYLNKKDKYAMFLDNNHPLIKITNNDIKNRGSLLVIKDSYANSMIPFLVNHYSYIYVIDPRYYKKSISKYMDENNINDVLFLYNIGTLSSDSNILSVR